MRKGDIDVLERVRNALVRYLPKEESQLLTDFLATYENLSGKYQRERERYRENADYYRDVSAKWKKEHPGQFKKHQQDHLKRKKRKEQEIMATTPIPAKLVHKGMIVSELADSTFYYGTDLFFPDASIFLRIGSYIITTPGIVVEDGLIRIQANKGRYHCYAICTDQLLEKRLIDAQLVMTYFEKRASINGMSGVRTDYGHVTHSFMDKAPDRYLLRAEPLLKILAAANVTGNAFDFSITTLDGRDIEPVVTVTPQYFAVEDDLSALPEFYDLIEQVPELNNVYVHSTAYRIGKGTPMQMPEELIREILRYGVKDYIALEAVICLDESRFTVMAENFR